MKGDSRWVTALHYAFQDEEYLVRTLGSGGALPGIKDRAALPPLPGTTASFLALRAGHQAGQWWRTPVFPALGEAAAGRSLNETLSQSNQQTQLATLVVRDVAQPCLSRAPKNYCEVDRCPYSESDS